MEADVFVKLRDQFGALCVHEVHAFSELFWKEEIIIRTFSEKKALDTLNSIRENKGYQASRMVSYFVKF